MRNDILLSDSIEGSTIHNYVHISFFELFDDQSNLFSQVNRYTFIYTSI